MRALTLAVYHIEPSTAVYHIELLYDAVCRTELFSIPEPSYLLFTAFHTERSHEIGFLPQFPRGRFCLSREMLSVELERQFHIRSGP